VNLRKILWIEKKIYFYAEFTIFYLNGRDFFSGLRNKLANKRYVRLEFLNQFREELETE
jgi:hypothetical protein